jgi:uncharacterized protein (TIGR02453 family)
MDRFEGFSKDGARFFENLKKHMNREWFQAHKAEYQALWAGPMQALLEELSAKLVKSYPDCELGRPKVLRIQRDTRFSRDKTPYKLHCAGMIPVQRSVKATETPAAMYVHLGLETILGAGLYSFDKAGLDRYRKAVDDETTGKELAALLKKLVKPDVTIHGPDALRRVPRGFDPAHPRAELLRFKGLILGLPRPDQRVMESREFLPWLVTHGKKAAPLVRWLAYNAL